MTSPDTNSLPLYTARQLADYFSTKTDGAYTYRTIAKMCAVGELPGAYQVPFADASQESDELWRIPQVSANDWLVKHSKSPSDPSDKQMQRDENKPFYRKVWFQISAAVFFMAALFGLWADGANVFDRLSAAFPTPMPFVAAEDRETLIVIAKFDGAAASEDEPHWEIQQRLREEIAKLGDKNIKVELNRNVVLQPEQRQDAEALGKLCNATMVIWGKVTGVHTIVNFLNIRETNPDDRLVTIDETEPNLRITPDAYSQFITDDLPNQMAFLALFAIGKAYTNDQKYVRAKDTIELAIDRLDESNAGVDSGADAYNMLGFAALMLKEDTDEILGYFDDAIKRDPKYLYTYYNRGLIYYMHGKLDEAIADYTQAIQLKPTEALGYARRADAYIDNGDISAAISDYQTAARLFKKIGNITAAEGEMKRSDILRVKR